MLFAKGITLETVENVHELLQCCAKRCKNTKIIFRKNNLNVKFVSKHVLGNVL